MAGNKILSASPSDISEEPVINDPMYWVHSYSTLCKAKFAWSIHNISVIEPEAGGAIISPLFHCSTDEKLKWNLELYHTVDDNGYLSVRLKSSGSNEQCILGRVEFSLMNSEFKKIRTFITKIKIVWNSWANWPEFIRISKLLPNDTLTILCELKFSSVENHTFIKHRFDQLEIAAVDLGTLLKSPKFSDVSLVCGEHVLHAHKAILAARSDTFAAMFDHKNKELEDVIKIDDIDYDVVEEMLNFIYTGHAPKLKQKAEKLLVAADKFSLKILKNQCEKALYTDLTVGTAIKLLIFADIHKADQLKKGTLGVIKQFGEEIIRTESWKNLKNSKINSPAIYEAMEAIIS